MDEFRRRYPALRRMAESSEASEEALRILFPQFFKDSRPGGRSSMACLQPVVATAGPGRDPTLSLFGVGFQDSARCSLHVIQQRAEPLLL